MTNAVSNGNVPGGTTAFIGGATVTAGNNVNVDAREVLNLTVFPGVGAVGGGSIGASISIVEEEAVPQAYLTSGTVVTAAQNFDMEGDAANTEVDNAPIPSVGVGSLGIAGLADAEAGSASSSQVQAGSTVTANTATVAAINNNSFDTEAWAIAAQSSGPAGIGATLVITDYVSSAVATVSGKLTTTGNVNVNAESNNNLARNASSASVLGQKGGTAGSFFNSLGSFFSNLSTTVGSGIQSFGSGLKSTLGSSGPSLAFAAAVGLATSQNSAQASIGNNAHIDVAGNLTVYAFANDNFQVAASGSASDASFASIGGGVVDSNYSNQATAWIGQDAVVRVTGTLDVNANALVPNQVNINYSIPGIGTLGGTVSLPDNDSATGTGRLAQGWNNAQTNANSGVSGLSAYLLTVFSPSSALSEGVANSVVSSSATTANSGKVGVAGGLNVLNYNNSANAYIAAGAQIDEGFAIPPPNQNVTVESYSNVQTINIAGHLTLFGEGFGASNSSGGAGGSVEILNFTTSSTAHIDNGAIVDAANNVTVHADNLNYMVTIVQAGANATNISLGGAVAVDSLTSTTLANIDDGAKVTAGNNVAVTASNHNVFITAACQLVAGNTVAVGGGVCLNFVTDTTKAFIGDVAPSTGSGGTVTAQNDVNVTASSTQRIWNVAASGADSSQSDGQSSVAPMGAPGVLSSTSPTSSSSSGSGSSMSFGFGASGSVAYNSLNEDTEGFIQGSVTVTASQVVNVDATTDILMVAVPVAAAYGTKAAIAGSFAYNGLNATTKAWTENVQINADNLSLAATSSEIVIAVALGGSGTNNYVALGGSVDDNSLTNITKAYIGSGSVVVTAGNVTVNATNAMTVVSVAGTLALFGNVAIAASLDIESLNNTVYAYIDGGANVTAQGNVSVFASTNDLLISICTTFAGSTTESGVAAAGAGTISTVTDDVEAYVKGTVTTPSSVYIGANDQTQLIVIDGAAGGGNSAVDVGVSAADNTVNQTVEAYLGQGAVVTATGNGSGDFDPAGSGFGGTGISLSAQTNNVILVIAAGVAVSSNSTAVAGSVALNNVSGNTAAFTEGATVNLPVAQVNGAPLRLQGNYATDITTVGGGFGGGSDFGVGAAVATNTISDTAAAYIDKSTVQSPAGSEVSLAAANNPASILCITVGAGVGSTGGLAGSVSLNKVNNTTDAHISGGSQVTGFDGITLTATDDPTIEAFAGAVAGASTAAVAPPSRPTPSATPPRPTSTAPRSRRRACRCPALPTRPSKA